MDVKFQNSTLFQGGYLSFRPLQGFSQRERRPLGRLFRAKSLWLDSNQQPTLQWLCKPLSQRIGRFRQKNLSKFYKPDQGFQG